MCRVLLIMNSFMHRRWSCFITTNVIGLTPKEEAIMTENNREFEQSPAIEQLFMVYYRRAEEEEEGEWLLAIDILRRIQKASKMTFSARQASYFGRILQRLGVKSKRKTYGTYYHVVPLEVE